MAVLRPKENCPFALDLQPLEKVGTGG